MKKLTIILFALIHITLVHAQKWEKLIGLPNRDDYGLVIHEHYDLGYLITSTIMQGSGNYHGLIIKTDINGDVLWDKQIGLLPDRTTIVGLRYDDQGNIYTFGWFKSPDFAAEFPFIVKLNACGEKLWCHMFPLEGYQFGFFTDAIIIENGDLLCLAYMPEDDPSNNNRILVFRVSPDGEFLWKKGYATHEDHPYYGDPIGMELKQFGDQYIISGTVYSPYPHDPNPYHVWMRPMFIGIDADFEEEWIVEFGISDSLLGKAYGTYQLNDSIYMGFGANRYVENGLITENSLIMFYNRDGVETGHAIIDGSDIAQGINQNNIRGIERIDQEKFICAAGIGEEYQGAPYGEMVIDITGEVYNYAIREHTSGTGNYIDKTFDGKYVFSTTYQLPGQNEYIYHYKLNADLEQDTIYPGTYTYDSLCRHTIESGIIDLTGCDVTVSIGEIPTLDQYNHKLKSIAITASPNPSNTGEVLLEYENTQSFANLHLRVSNVYGKLIHHEAVLPLQGATRLHTGNWPPGIYIAVVYSDGSARGKAKFVVR